MKEFIKTSQSSERTILVGLITPEVSETQAEEYLDELAFLSETAGAEPVARFLQRLDTPNPATFVGKGKLDEIAEYVSHSSRSSSRRSTSRRAYSVRTVARWCVSPSSATRMWVSLR